MHQRFLSCSNQLAIVNTAQFATNHRCLRYDVSPILHRSITRNSAASSSIDLLHKCTNVKHDDVIKWKHFSRYWPFVRRIHRSPVNYPHKGQWRRALIFSLICAWINGWVNNRKAGDLRLHNAHYDVTVMVQYITMNNFLDLGAYPWSFVGSLEELIPILMLHFLMPFDIIKMTKRKRENSHLAHMHQWDDWKQMYIIKLFRILDIRFWTILICDWNTSKNRNERTRDH